MDFPVAPKTASVKETGASGGPAPLLRVLLAVVKRTRCCLLMQPQKVACLALHHRVMAMSTLDSTGVSCHPSASARKRHLLLRSANQSTGIMKLPTPTLHHFFRENPLKSLQFCIKFESPPKWVPFNHPCYWSTLGISLKKNIGNNREDSGSI